MRQYYEANEILIEDSTIIPDFIRIDITDMSTVERNEVLQLIKDQFVNINHTLILHNCRHDENPKSQCTFENII